MNLFRHRHQLNHNSKQTFHCRYPDCTRTFVRGDLLKRHLDRHTQKGSQLNRRGSMSSQSASATPGSPGVSTVPVSREASRPMLPNNQYQTPHSPKPNQYSSIAQTPSVGYSNSPADPSMSGFAHDQDFVHSPSFHPQQASVPPTNVAPYGVASPASTPHGMYSQPHSPHRPVPAPFVPQQNMLPFNLPTAQYVAPRDGHSAYIGGTSAEFSTTNQLPPTELAMFDQMAMPGTVPVFGDGANKSPYVGMPEDFMAYLFNSPAGDQSPVLMASQYPK